MWTDWQFTAPSDAKINLAALVASQVGDVVKLTINGRSNEFQPRTDAERSRKIQDLQTYIFECEENGWEWNAAFDPRLQRPGITRAKYTG